MSDGDIDKVPEGFERVPEGFGYTDSLQPVYRRVDGTDVSFGLVIQARHGNSMGICHGGVLMTLADMTATSGCNVARGDLVGNPTLSLNVDFVSAARQGQWIQADAEQVSLKRRFGFCSGHIRNSSGIVARFNGTIYFPDHEGLWQDDRRRESVLNNLGD